MITNFDLGSDTSIAQLLADHVTDMVFFATSDGSVEFVNACWQAFTGQSLDEACGDGYLDRIHADDRGLFIQTWRTARAAGSEMDAFVRCLSADGGYRLDRARFSPLEEAGLPPRGWLVIIINTSAHAASVGSFGVASAGDMATQLFGELARRTPSLLLSFDCDAQIDFINDRWSHILGVDAQKMLGEGWKQFVFPDDVERICAELQRHFSGGDPYTAPWRICRPDGTYRWVELHAEPAHDDDGRVVRWYGTGTDIDEKRRTMDALELLADSDTAALVEGDVDTTLSCIASAALAGMAEFAIFDIDNKIGGMRRVIVRTLQGLPRSEIPMIELTPPALNSMHPIAQAMRTRRSVFHPSIDAEFIEGHIEAGERRNSWRESRVQSIIVSPIVIHDRLLGALTLIRTDQNIPFDRQDVRVVEEVARRTAVVMEHIRLRDRARAASAEQDEHFHRVADAIPQLMWISDAAGTLEWVNKRWLDFTGRTLDEALHESRERLVHPDDEARVRGAWQTASESVESFECEYRMIGADGQPCWFLARATPVETSVGLRWYGTNTDIDDAHRAVLTSGIFADVGEALAESLGLQATLDAVMRTVVPRLADWALISLVDESGELHLAKMHCPEGDISPELAALAALRSCAPLAMNQASLDDVGLIIPLIAGTTVRGVLTLLISESARLLDSGDLPFYTELGRRIAPSIANAEIFERERRVAHSFQQAALPATLPAPDGFLFSAVYEAGRAEALVGGDWYDAFKLLDGRFVVSIGDVAGSGLRAAVMMANIRQAIRGVAHVHADPELMLEAADRALRSDNPDYFATAFVGVVDPVANTITYKNAGHPAPLLTMLDGRVAELHSDGLPLGLRDPDRTPGVVHELPFGSVLILYTDGLIEATRDVLDGEARLREAVKHSRGSDPLQRAQAIYDAVLTAGSRDDVAILCMTVVRSRRLYWTLDARDVEETMRLRSEILGELCSKRTLEVQSITAELVLAELIGNLVRYAPEPAEISLEWDHGHAILHVRDNGPGFAFTPKLPNDVFSENGRGLFLIAALSDDFNVTRRPEGGSHARVVFRP